MVPNMKAKYTAEVAPALMKKFQYESAMQIPKLDKIVINVGFWPEIRVISRTIASITLELPFASLPQPTLITILSSFGICIALSY